MRRDKMNADNSVEFHPGDIARRIAEAMSPEKPASFARRVNISGPTISKYLDGEVGRAQLDMMAKIADGLGTSLDWLVWGRGEGPDSSARVLRIPRYDATLAAGVASWNDGRRKIEDMPFTQAFLQQQLGRTSARGLTILEARGDSMYPTIHDRALLVVDEEDKRLIDDVSAFVLAGDARVKRFKRRIDGLQILSDNTAYPPEDLDDRQARGLEVIGRVLLVMQRVTG